MDLNKHGGYLLVLVGALVLSGCERKDTPTVTPGANAPSSTTSTPPASGASSSGAGESSTASGNEASKHSSGTGNDTSSPTYPPRSK